MSNIKFLQVSAAGDDGTNCLLEETTVFDGSRNYDYATPYIAVPNLYQDGMCRLDQPIVSQPRYEALYWHPSNEEEELMMEIEKLNLKMFKESDLE